MFFILFYTVSNCAITVHKIILVNYIAMIGFFELILESIIAMLVFFGISPVNP